MGISKPFAEISYKELMFMCAPTIPYTHCFTTKSGGVSSGVLESLNLGENRGDTQENVQENYSRLLEALALPEQGICFTKQVHGNEVRVVYDEDRRRPYDPFEYEADGLVTGVRGLPIMCFSADCVPILLSDSEAEVIGAIHCGWRSTTMDILGVAIKKMIALGANPRDMRAAIGPAIEMCCYETDGDVPAAIEGLLGSDTEGTFFPVADTGKFMVDLKETNRKRLLQLGLPEENISVSDECTCCSNDRYWSHRFTKGERGSQAAIIIID